MTLRISLLEEAAWPTLRAVRLAALRESPAAFWATWEEESAFDPEGWRRLVRAAAWFVARREREPVGVAGCLRREECPTEPEVVGMWVHPAARGRDVADRLLDAIRSWATQEGMSSLVLWVVEDNERARRIYERHRFCLTGERAPLPEGRSGHEERMRCDLGRPG